MELQPVVIQYMVLLDNRKRMPFYNVPPSTIVHPLLRNLGNLPQHMAHFIYGNDYYAILLKEELQLGYNLKFFHPDTIGTLSSIPYSERDVYVFLFVRRMSRTDNYMPRR